MKSLKFIVICLTVFLFCFSACDNGTTTTPGITTGGSSGGATTTGGDTGGSDDNNETPIFPEGYTPGSLSRVDVVFNGPPQSGIGDSDYQSSSDVITAPQASISDSGNNTAVTSFSYPYSASATASTSSSGTLSAHTQLQAEGHSGSLIDEYQLFGDVYHDVYFKAVSNNPATTRISLEADISFTGHADFNRENDNVKVFSSMTLKAQAYTMGWGPSELGGMEYKPVGPILADHEGYAVVGYQEGIIQPNCQDWFLGEVTPGSLTADVSVTKKAGFETQPDQVIKIYLTIMARSIIEFTGMHAEHSCVASAEADISSVSWSVTAEDPDHPDAEITIIYYVPE